jgi:hypothetical protein
MLFDSFERDIKNKVDNLKLAPSKEVWVKLNSQLAVERMRRKIWLVSTLGCVILFFAAGTSFFINQNALSSPLASSDDLNSPHLGSSFVEEPFMDSSGSFETEAKSEDKYLSDFEISSQSGRLASDNLFDSISLIVNESPIENEVQEEAPLEKGLELDFGFLDNIVEVDKVLDRVLNKHNSSQFASSPIAKESIPLESEMGEREEFSLTANTNYSDFEEEDIDVEIAPIQPIHLPLNVEESISVKVRGADLPLPKASNKQKLWFAYQGAAYVAHKAPKISFPTAAADYSNVDSWNPPAPFPPRQSRRKSAS